jgi:hypothetical protein
MQRFKAINDDYKKTFAAKHELHGYASGYFIQVHETTRAFLPLSFGSGLRWGSGLQ